jgi:hypothetical protein
MRISCFADNPVKYTDPDGKKDKPVIAGLSGALPLVGEINTGNRTADSLIAGTGNIWNTFASAVNAVVRYTGDLSNATDAIVTMADGIIPDELSLTGSGLKEDLYVGSLFGGMNPGAIAEGLQHAKNLASSIQGSVDSSNGLKAAQRIHLQWFSGTNDSRTAQQIISAERKASINSVFPSQWYNKTLNEINTAAQSGDATAKTAWKLLRDNRFFKDK